MAKSIAKVLITLVFFIGISQAMMVKYKDCGSKSIISEVDVSPCTSQPCVLIKGSNETIDVHFTPEKDIKSVAVNLQGIIGGVPLPFPVPHPDACSWPGSGLKCPLKKGQQQHYTMQLPVRHSYPSLKLLAKLSLVDQTKSALVCVEIALQIK
ncbi:NPC intracellular cholesterol transporter 2-like [Rhopilema esculentum]|uniref:NPC intracellular cholesterol transporter 2-like n=1 Tax=Rhopilema esculentum TaxID=499914 RepID=UPI0031D53D14|eukprot:gene3480-1862_t